jgi:hypothetical protein
LTLNCWKLQFFAIGNVKNCNFSCLAFNTLLKKNYWKKCWNQHSFFGRVCVWVLWATNEPRFGQKYSLETSRKGMNKRVTPWLIQKRIMPIQKRILLTILQGGSWEGTKHAVYIYNLLCCIQRTQVLCWKYISLKSYNLKEFFLLNSLCKWCTVPYCAMQGRMLWNEQCTNKRHNLYYTRCSFQNENVGSKFMAYLLPLKS